MLRISNMAWNWTAAGQPEWLAQARVLLASFGLASTLMYLSSEVAGKTAALARSLYTK